MKKKITRATNNNGSSSLNMMLSGYGRGLWKNKIGSTNGTIRFNFKPLRDTFFMEDMGGMTR